MTRSGYRRDSRVKILSDENSVAYSPQTTVQLSNLSRKVCVDVSGLCASWSFERDKQVLTDITFQVDKVKDKCKAKNVTEYFCIVSVKLNNDSFSLQENPLMAVAGPVGAGKVMQCQCTSDSL